MNFTDDDAAKILIDNVRRQAAHNWARDIRHAIITELPDIVDDRHISRDNIAGREHVIYLYDRMNDCYIQIEVKPAKKEDAVQHGVHGGPWLKPLIGSGNVICCRCEVAIHHSYENTDDGPMCQACYTDWRQR